MLFALQSTSNSSRRECDMRAGADQNRCCYCSNKSKAKKKTTTTTTHSLTRWKTSHSPNERDERTKTLRNFINKNRQLLCTPLAFLIHTFAPILLVYHDHAMKRNESFLFIFIVHAALLRCCRCVYRRIEYIVCCVRSLLAFSHVATLARFSYHTSLPSPTMCARVCVCV